MSAPPDPRLILREDELDAGVELMLLAEASLWAAVDQGLEAEGLGLGRSHWRAAFLQPLPEERAAEGREPRRMARMDPTQSVRPRESGDPALDSRLRGNERIRLRRNARISGE